MGTDSISSGPIMNGLVTNGHHKIKCPDITLDNGMDVIEQDIHGISDYSGRLENILLSLLKQQDLMKIKIEEVVADSIKKEQELNAKIEEKFNELSASVEKEAAERSRVMQGLEDKMLQEIATNGDDLEEIKNRENQNKELEKKFTDDVEKCNDACSKINEILNAENEKRKREAEELQERLEREKRELQDDIENDNKALKEKLDNE